MTLRYGSVCSGIEAATVAWHPLGWRPAFFSEIEAFPRAVLAHHYPKVPLHGDFTTIRAGEYEPIDLLVGGTPCQSFSIAGLRGGLDDDRGNLALEYLRLAQRLRARWLVWENVPGVLSSAGGRDFGAILGGMVELGYGFAYRVLDAQFIRVDGHPRAVPQRRRRVFVVGYLGDWRRAAAVLFERESLSGHPAPRREPGKGTAGAVARSVALRGREGGGTAELCEDFADTLRASTGGGDKPHALVAFGGNDTTGPISVATARSAHGGPHGRLDFESETFLVSQPVAPTLRAGGNQTGGDRPYGTDVDTCDSLIPIAFDTTQITSPTNRSTARPGNPCHPLAAGAHPPAIAFDARQSDVCVYGEKTGPLDTDASTIGIQSGWAVRRLTPRECERLQGFPDDYTLIPHRKGMAADGLRYKALGNSMACNVMRWLGQRIAMVEALSFISEAAE